MSYFPFSTALDLKLDALSIAGEPQDGSSVYDANCYNLIQSVQNSLISGGMMGPALLKPMDWLWARAYPRGVIQMQLPVNAGYALTAAFVQGSNTVNITGGTLPATNIRFWRLYVESFGSRPYVLDAGSGGTTITLRDPWAEVNSTTQRWLAFQAEYDLPADFVRFASPIQVSGWPYEIDVVAPQDLEREYPFTLIGPGFPILASQVTESKVRFSHWLGSTAQGATVDQPLQTEFEYIGRPEPITDDGVIPRLPHEHRRILSYGAAYQIMDDKSDSDRDRILTRFNEQYRAMQDEHRKNMSNASKRWGTVIPRSLDEPRLLRTPYGLRTAGGLPVF